MAMTTYASAGSALFQLQRQFRPLEYSELVKCSAKELFDLHTQRVVNKSEAEKRQIRTSKAAHLVSCSPVEVRFPDLKNTCAPIGAYTHFVLKYEACRDGSRYTLIGSKSGLVDGQLMVGGEDPNCVCAYDFGHPLLERPGRGSMVLDPVHRRNAVIIGLLLDSALVEASLDQTRRPQSRFVMPEYYAEFTRELLPPAEGTACSKEMLTDAFRPAREADDATTLATTEQAEFDGKVVGLVTPEEVAKANNQTEDLYPFVVLEAEDGRQQEIALPPQSVLHVEAGALVKKGQIVADLLPRKGYPSFEALKAVAGSWIDHVANRVTTRLCDTAFDGAETILRPVELCPSFLRDVEQIWEDVGQLIDQKTGVSKVQVVEGQTSRLRFKHRRVINVGLTHLKEAWRPRFA